MKTLYQAAVVAFALITASSQAADLMGCEQRFYGSADAAGPGPVSRAPLYSSEALLGGIRMSLDGPVRDPNVKETLGFSAMQVVMGEEGIDSVLAVIYQHAVKLGADGKPEKAVQKACLYSEVSKDGVHVVTSTTKECRGIIIGSAPVRVFSEDPFDPKNGWKEVAIKNGEAQLEINEEQFVETPSGSGVLKIACSNYDEEGPVLKPVPFIIH